MKNQIIVVAVTLAVWLGLSIVWVESSAEQGAKQKAVLVTGASTGIGRNIAERLASEGYFVYAGARKEKDLEALNQI